MIRDLLFLAMYIGVPLVFIGIFVAIFLGHWLVAVGLLMLMGLCVQALKDWAREG